MKILEFEKKLKLATSFLDLNLALKRYLADFGIKTYAYTHYTYHPSSQTKLKYDFSTENFKIWHKHFVSENYDAVDTTLDKVYRSTLPIFWNLQKQLHEAKTSRERQMRLDSIAFGSEQGLSIPIHGPEDDFAILLLVQMRGQNCLDNWRVLQYELLAAAHVYYFYLQKQLIKDQTKKNKKMLNDRETECLILFAKHFTVTAIAKKLKLTPRTIHHYSQQINKKLGTNNKYQSILKALQKGLITL